MNKFMMIIFTFLFFTSFNLLASETKETEVYYYIGPSHSVFNWVPYDIGINKNHDSERSDDLPYYGCALEFGTKVIAYDIGEEFASVEVQEDQETKSEHQKNDSYMISYGACKKDDRLLQINWKNLSPFRKKISTLFEIGQFTKYIGETKWIQPKNSKGQTVDFDCLLQNGITVKIHKRNLDDSLKVEIEIEQMDLSSTSVVCYISHTTHVYLDELLMETKEFLY